MKSVDGKDVPERTDKRIPCPVCEGNKRVACRNDGTVVSCTDEEVRDLLDDTFSMTQEGEVVTLTGMPCSACDGLGEVCVCPVCEGEKMVPRTEYKRMPGRTPVDMPPQPHLLPCAACKGVGWVKVSNWDAAVDVGHGKIMEEHAKEQKETLTDKPSDGIARLVIVHRHAMAAVMQEWERVCRENLMTNVDAGAYGSVLGGMTVEYLKRMEEEMGIGRHQVFARFVNGMLAYMESRGDAKGIGIVAGQSGECYSSARQGAEIQGDKEKMH